MGHRAIIITGGGKWVKAYDTITAELKFEKLVGKVDRWVYEVPSDAVIDEEGRFRYLITNDPHRLVKAIPGV